MAFAYSVGCEIYIKYEASSGVKGGVLTLLGDCLNELLEVFLDILLCLTHSSWQAWEGNP